MSYKPSDKLQKQMRVEFSQLNQLLETHRPLLEKCKISKPDPMERSALAAMLHAFYTGIENLLKRIALEMNGELPEGEFWHRNLLEEMAVPAQNRPAIISPALKESLRNYLEFRHVFRHAYTFELRWEKMSVLVRDCEKVLQEIELELNSFFRIEKKPE
jgi:hypothetical protein